MLRDRRLPFLKPSSALPDLEGFPQLQIIRRKAASLDRQMRRAPASGRGWRRARSAGRTTYSERLSSLTRSFLAFAILDPAISAIVNRQASCLARFNSTDLQVQHDREQHCDLLRYSTLPLGISLRGGERDAEKAGCACLTEAECLDGGPVLIGIHFI